MHLHEEYLARNSLDVPLILYSNKSIVFLKHNTVPVKWGIMSITWRPPEGHPGYFLTSFSSVVHNSWRGGEMIVDDTKPEAWHWDEYENKLKLVVNVLKQRKIIAVESKEQSLAAWQLFLIIYDSWLADCMNDDFFKNVAISINPELSFEDRHDSLYKAQQMLLESKTAYEYWIHQVWPLAKLKSEWLIRLIND